MNERDAYIALNMMAGVGPVGVRALAAALGSAAAIFDAGRDALVAAQGASRDLVEKILDQRSRVDPEKELERTAKLGIRVVTRVDADYPARLAEIHDPPLALYVQGSLDARDKHAIAVVGSRRTTHYGLATAERLSYQLVQAGFTVVSGLARGIDTAAHRGALKGKGRTLAVLGGGIDCLYPPENAELAEAISRQGAVLSEFPLGREPDRNTFPIRNRIISGLSMGVLVVEAGLDSGAMITAAQGLDQGRSIFAVPGRIDSLPSKGCHNLIKNGARLVEGVEDILEEFALLLPREKASAGGRHDTSVGEGGSPLPVPELTAEEAGLVRVLQEEETLDIDALTRMSGLRTASVVSALIGLEMKKVVRMLPGRMVEYVRR